MTEEQSGSGTGTGTRGIDEPTAREMMGYYKISHDEFVKYVKNWGIDHDD